jgi:hypothetical protein
MANDPATPGLEPVNLAAPATETAMTPRNAPAREDAPRPRAHDLTGGTRGMTGSSYVVGGLDDSHVAEDGTPVYSFGRHAIPVRTVNRCEHIETVCAKCAEVWMYDWTFYFDRTIGGRRLRNDLGGEAALAAMAARRAAWENQAATVEAHSDPGTAEQVSPGDPACATAVTG